MTRLRSSITTALVLAFFTSFLSAQGVETRRSAVVLFGAAGSCTQPAEIDYKKVSKKTPEYKTIRSEGVSKGSARYSILMSKMKKRIKRACRLAAQDGGNDLVVRKGDIADKRGQTVKDLSSAVISKLES